MIPQTLNELKALRQWVNFVRIWDPGKHEGAGGYDKPPINPHTLWDGKTTDPATWATYDEAAANIGKTANHRDRKHPDANGNAPLLRVPIEGAGLVLSAGYCGLDFDDVIDDAGNVPQWVADLIDRLDTYTEISPSGHGLHSLLCCGDLLAAGKSFGRQFLLKADGSAANRKNKVYELEIYFYTDGGRYFTVTGNTYRDRPINHGKGEELRAIYSEYSRRDDESKAAERPARSAGTQYAATDDDNRKMINSALAAIDPAELDFNKWAAIMTALKVSGYSLDEAQAWSRGDMCGSVNPINNEATNARRWYKFSFKRGDESAAGIIINEAKLQGWTPADAWDDEARAEYGRSLYTEEQRRQYGRAQHEKRAGEWWKNNEGGFYSWRTRRKINETGLAAKTPTATAEKKLTPEEIRAMMKEGL